MILWRRDCWYDGLKARCGSCPDVVATAFGISEQFMVDIGLEHSIVTLQDLGSA
jgi:hypothetical protein